MKPKKTIKKLVIENVVSLGLAIFLVLVIRSSVIEAYKIPSGSMIPTLLVGDHIFVNKFSYGLKVPFGEFATGKPVYIFRRDPPARGDIIVFKYPPQEETIFFIKRVVGTPGDTIEVKDKVLFVNGEAVKISPIPDDRLKKIQATVDPVEYRADNLNIHYESFPKTTGTVMWDRGVYMTSNFGPEKVPADSYFVMGDNRDHSNDSRFWGFVPMDNIKGRAMVIWFSIWLDFGKSSFAFNPSRIGTILH